MDINKLEVGSIFYWDRHKTTWRIDVINLARQEISAYYLGDELAGNDRSFRGLRFSDTLFKEARLIACRKHAGSITPSPIGRERISLS